MKKLLLSAAFLSATFIGANAQAISFEASEGYVLGNLNEQNGWGVTQLPDNPNNPTFTVVSTMATDGSNSFYGEGTNIQYQNSQGQIVLIGAFSDLMSISADAFEISADFRLTTPTTEGNGSDVHFGAQSTTEELLTSRVVFNYQGNIRVVDNPTGTAAYQDVATYQYDTWYNLKIRYNFSAGSIEYFLDNTSIYTGNVWTAATTVDQLTFLFDNYESGFYVDNIVVNTTLSTDTVLEGLFSVYPNPVKDMLNISNSIGAEINTVTVTDINGRTVKQLTVTGVEAQINIADLNTGVYFVNINTNEGSLTKKIVKQ